MAKDWTPVAMRCITGTCPSIHELEDGRLLVVGLQAGMIVPPEEVSTGPHESAIVIERGLLADYLASIKDGKTE